MEILIEKQTYAIGDNVEKFCPACETPLGHIVKSLTRTGAVSRVRCSKCGLSGTYKPSSEPSKKKNPLPGTGAPYNRAKTYRAGQLMIHPIFGAGEVMAVFGTKTIDVLFTDRVRRLIHSRN